MTILEKYLPLRAPDDGAGGGSGGGGGGNGSGGGAGGAVGGDGGSSGAGGGAGASGAGGSNGGDSGGPWYSTAGLDADTSKFLEGKQYPDLKTALTSLRHADEVARSRNVIDKPDPKNLKGWKGWTELGYEPDATKYQLAKPQVKDGQKIDDRVFGVMQKAAHENMVPAAQASAIFEAIQADAFAQEQEFQTLQANTAKEVMTKLQTEWGKDFEAKKTLATRAFQWAKPGEVTSAQLEAITGNADLMRLFAKIGEAMGEDKLVTSQGDGGGFGGQSKTALEAELNRLEADPDTLKVLNNPRDPRNAEITQRRQNLINRIAAAA
jgi:hypothetical protein